MRCSLRYGEQGERKPLDIRTFWPHLADKRCTVCIVVHFKIRQRSRLTSSHALILPFHDVCGSATQRDAQGATWRNGASLPWAICVSRVKICSFHGAKRWPSFPKLHTAAHSVISRYPRPSHDPRTDAGQPARRLRRWRQRDGAAQTPPTCGGIESL